MTTDTVHADGSADAGVSDAYRWTQLAIGVAAMVMHCELPIWLDFSPGHPEEIRLGWGIDSVGIYLFVLFETSLVPVKGWFLDKYGSASWFSMAASSPSVGDQRPGDHPRTGYYLGMIVAGIGAG